MRLQDNGDSLALWVSAFDTYNWAHRPGDAWPCSTLSGHRFMLEGDHTGLLGFTLDGKDAGGRDVDAHELSACVADMLKDRLPRDHSCWFVFVGQFQKGE